MSCGLCGVCGVTSPLYTRARGAPRKPREPAALVNLPGSWSAGFIERHGELVQVELDALPPETLRPLFDSAVTQFWDTSACEAALAREEDDVVRLRRIAGAA